MFGSDVSAREWSVKSSDSRNLLADIILEEVWESAVNEGAVGGDGNGGLGEDDGDGRGETDEDGFGW